MYTVCAYVGFLIKHTFSLHGINNIKKIARVLKDQYCIPWLC